MPSPTCTVNGSATSGGVNVNALTLITIQLVDLTATAWTLTCIGTDDGSSSPSISVNHLTKTATFTTPSNASAFVFQSVVNNGLGANGQVDSSLTTTFAVYVLTGAGNRVIAFNETLEGNSVGGWLYQINTVIRGATTSTTSTQFDPVAGVSKASSTRKLERTSTSNNTATTIGTPIAAATANSTYAVTAWFIAQKSDTQDSFCRKVIRKFNTNGSGTVTALGALATDTNESFDSGGTTTGMAVDLAASGTTVLAKGTGRTGENWRWTVITVTDFTSNAA